MMPSTKARKPPSFGQKQLQQQQQQQHKPYYTSLLWLLVAFYLGRHSSSFGTGSASGSARDTTKRCMLEDATNETTVSVLTTTATTASTIASSSSGKTIASGIGINSNSHNNNNNNRNDNGWHSIDVFYGNTSHLDAIPPPPNCCGPNMKAIQDWYSQAGQDRIVMELFQNKRNGYFIDLAANDARTLSNTFALERRFDWTGLCVEPNPQYWHDLSYRSCQVVAAVVGRHRMEEFKFRFEAGPGGGIVDNQFDSKPAADQRRFGTKAPPPNLKFTVPLLEILKRYNTPKVIDYLSLDVEGAEEYIMGIFPLEEYSIRVMTVERPNEELQAFLKKHGFQMIESLSRWGETMWAHESFLKEINYQPKIVQA